MDIIISCKRVKVKRDSIKGVIAKILKNLDCPDNAEISILFTDNDFIRELNKRYLKKDRPTDVLSFPMDSVRGKNGSRFTVHGSRYLLGDIVISVEKAKEQAKSMNVPMDMEIKRLLIHGILHLFGYEHEKGGIKAKKMKREEERLICDRT
ncbi:MAG: rRNA maturation RNase YbeY [Deltaproteobacteria bacterium]|nr:rRNA maturation RNase YbeY [Deltaproteobacteria bacterium]